MLFTVWIRFEHSQSIRRFQYKTLIKKVPANKSFVRNDPDDKKQKCISDRVYQQFLWSFHHFSIRGAVTRAGTKHNSVPAATAIIIAEPTGCRSYETRRDARIYIDRNQLNLQALFTPATGSRNISPFFASTSSPYFPIAFIFLSVSFVIPLCFFRNSGTFFVAELSSRKRCFIEETYVISFFISIVARGPVFFHLG